MRNCLAYLKLRDKNKWFAKTADQSDELWFGPHRHIEDAIRDAVSNDIDDCSIVYVGQGHKLTAAEIRDYGVEWTWEVDTTHIMELDLRLLPKEEKQ